MKQYNCTKCDNKGYIIVEEENGYTHAKDCECVKIRRTLQLAENSGLGDMLCIYKFDNYTTDQQWQMEYKERALEYCQEKGNKWFIAFGESGIGKTHLCTAICGNLIKQGYDVRYMSWLEVSGNLKRRVSESTYEGIIEPYKKCDVLYIDDFFKSDNQTPPTPADIKLANEILNYRYNRARINDKCCKTIISSERLIGQLIEYDSAIAGRIVEMSKGYLTEKTGREFNYRLKNFL